MQRYLSRLKAKNLLYIKQILFLLSALVKVLGAKKPACDGPDTAPVVSEQARLMETSEFMSETQIYNLNVYKLIRYMHKSKITHKLNGFAEKYNDGNVKVEKKAKGVTAFLQGLNDKENKDEEREDNTEAEVEKKKRTTGSPLVIVLEFLEALANVSSDSRVLVSVGSTVGAGSVKYCLLNPASQFTDIVKECR